jgi:hypothetical protein
VSGEKDGACLTLAPDNGMPPVRRQLLVLLLCLMQSFQRSNPYADGAKAESGCKGTTNIPNGKTLQRKNDKKRKVFDFLDKNRAFNGGRRAE